MFLEFLLLVAVACYLLYRYATINFDFFEKRDMPYHKPVPFVGFFKDAVMGKKSIFTVTRELYGMHDGSVYGTFRQRDPVLMIRDPEIIKEILIRDFDHFINRSHPFRDEDGCVFGKTLFFLRNTKWRDMRSTLTPAFTSAKMRQMFQLINQVAIDSVSYVKDMKQTRGTELDMKDFTTRFTNDVIASTAFGMHVNSFVQRENEFYMMGKKLTTLTHWHELKFLLHGNFGALMRLLKVEIFDKRIINYFCYLVLDGMKFRKEHNIHRPDMINLLMEARGMLPAEDGRTEHNGNWSDMEIAAQCLGFFFAGFQMSSYLICFAAHELMENAEVQAKLLQEIETVSLALHDKHLTYDALQGMKYMDMVISEVLRKWPPIICVDRLCNKDYVYESQGQRLEIKSGDYISIPIVGLHYDPQYYKMPERFDPERFGDHSKANVTQLTYLPFSAGPRSCIAQRFALLETKALLFHLVLNFHIEAARNTIIPLQLSTTTFSLIPKTGFQLKLRPRV